MLSQQEATTLAKNILKSGKTKVDLAEEIGISRLTLDRRLAGTRKWRRGEIALLSGISA